MGSFYPLTHPSDLNEAGATRNVLVVRAWLPEGGHYWIVVMVKSL